MLLAPFSGKRRLRRGNLHGHSTHSDGALSPEQVVARYRKLGYDFICLSDHLWPDEAAAAGQCVLDGRRFDADGFTTVPSAELHCFGKKYDNHGLWHIVANGLPLDFPAAGAGETGAELVARAAAAGAFVSVAHPEWHCLTAAEALLLQDAHAVEIYNHASAITTGRGSGIAVADVLLQEKRRILLTATDDSHFHCDDGGGGWVMVDSETPDAAGLVAALKAGRYYSSSGVEFAGIALDGSELTVETSPVEHICVVGAGFFAGAAHGPDLTRATFNIGALKSDWFRITAIDAAGRKAWSNPYWRADLAAGGDRKQQK